MSTCVAFSLLCTSPRHVSSPRASAFARGLCCGPAPLRTLPPPHPRPDACPFWGEAGTQALDSALSRGARVWGRMASSRGASVLPLSTQPPGTAVPAAGQGHRSGRSTRCLSKGPVSGAVLAPGADAWVWGSRGRAPLPVASLPPLKCSQRLALGQVCRSSGQGRGGPRQGSPTCGPQHHGRRRGGDRTESHLPPAAPTGPLAFPACSPGCRGGEKRQREVRVDSLHIRGTVPGPRWLILAPGSHSDPGKLLL